MMTISMVLISCATAAVGSDDEPFKTIAMFCGIGLVASFGLIAFGVDLTPAWI